jgi:hypothetical protein
VITGMIKETVDKRHVCVKFDSADIGTKTVASRYVIPSSGAIARPSLTVSHFITCLAIMVIILGRFIFVVMKLFGRY